MIEINAHGEKYLVPLTSGARCSCKLMEEDYIVVPFSTLEQIHFKVGDYADLAESQYDDMGMYETIRKKYVVKDPQVPTYNENTGGYDWQLRLDAYYWAWNNRVFKFRPRKFAQEASWGLTDKIGRFMEIFTDNLDAYGFGTFNVDIDEEYQEYIINLSFQGTKMIEALRMICDKVTEEYKTECEWWVMKDTIHIGRCELYGDEIVITNEGEDKNAETIIPEDSEQEYANRLIVFGGTQNLSSRYRKELYLTADLVTPDSDGVVVRDTTKVNFSPTWFRIGDRRYRPTDIVEARTQKSNGYYENDFLRIVNSYYAGGDNYYTKACGAVRLNNTRQTVRYKLKTTFQMRDFLRVGGTANGPYANDSQSPYDIRDAKAVLYLQRGNSRKVLGEVQRDQNTDAMSVVLEMEGESIQIDTDFVGNVWEVYVEYLVSSSGKSSSTLTDYGNIFATFDTEVEVQFTADDAFKVQTKVDLGYAQYDAIINPTMADPSRDEARDVKIIGLSSLDTGTWLSFPNIVRGKADSGYFTDGNDTVINSIVQRNLMLPASVGTNYIDVDEGMVPEQIVEKVVIFDKIFPKQTLTCGTTGSYTTDSEEQEADGQDVGIKEGVLTKTHYHYQFMLPDLEFSEDCLIPGIELGVTFGRAQKLSGLSFKVAWNPGNDTIGTDDGKHRWEIINNTDYGIELPNSLMKPEIGDEVIITGWNIEAAEGKESIIEKAEEELLEEAKKLAKRIAMDPHSYRIAMMSGYLKDYPRQDFPMVGRMVTIRNGYLFKEGQRSVRTIGYDVHLDIPYDTPTIFAGDKKEYSTTRSARERLDAIDNGNLSSTPLVTQ